MAKNIFKNATLLYAGIIFSGENPSRFMPPHAWDEPEAIYNHLARASINVPKGVTTYGLTKDISDIEMLEFWKHCKNGKATKDWPQIEICRLRLFIRLDCFLNKNISRSTKARWRWVNMLFADENEILIDLTSTDVFQKFFNERLSNRIGGLEGEDSEVNGYFARLEQEISSFDIVKRLVSSYASEHLSSDDISMCQNVVDAASKFFAYEDFPNYLQILMIIKVDIVLTYFLCAYQEIFSRIKDAKKQ